MFYAGYRVPTVVRSLKVSPEFYDGERIETKVSRLFNNEEAISDVAPRIYTERSKGVLPDYDIRSDRWEYATDAMDLVTKQQRAKSSSAPTEPIDREGANIKPPSAGNDDGGAQS